MVKPNSELRPRLRKIAQSLLEKTRAGQANWVPAAGADLQYELKLPESRIVLAYLSPRVEPDYLSLRLHTLSGVAVGALEADEPEPGEPLNPRTTGQPSEPNKKWTGRLFSRCSSKSTAP